MCGWSPPALRVHSLGPGTSCPAARTAAGAECAEQPFLRSSVPAPAANLSEVWTDLISAAGRAARRGGHNTAPGRGEGGGRKRGWKRSGRGQKGAKEEGPRMGKEGKKKGSVSGQAY